MDCLANWSRFHVDLIRRAVEPSGDERGVELSFILRKIHGTWTRSTTIVCYSTVSSPNSDALILKCIYATPVSPHLKGTHNEWYRREALEARGGDRTLTSSLVLGRPQNS